MKNDLQITTYQLDKSFGPVGSSAGTFVFIAGIISLYFSFAGLVLILLGAFVGFSSSSTTLDFENRRIRFSNDYFGFMKSGKWISFEPEMKIGIRQSGLFTSLPPMFSLMIIDPTGIQKEKLLPVNEYLQIVAASNFKQRTRMSMLYYHAEKLHYAVIGTPNKHEQEQGFFVKYGDGAGDVMPIGNLYKTQVYQVAEYLGVPKAIIDRTPTTDTYSAEQTQEEFFYQLPFALMDRFWYGFENGYPAEEVGAVMGETKERVEALYRNFERKRKTTEYLRMPPIRNYYGL